MDINQAKTEKTEHESGKSVKSWSRKEFFIFELELSKYTLEESKLGKISPWIYFSEMAELALIVSDVTLMVLVIWLPKSENI